MQILCKYGKGRCEDVKRKIMSVEIGVRLDTRRARNGGCYPLKLRVYYGGKAILYPTIYNLTKEDFSKLGAKRISDELGKLRALLREIERAASDAALNICPFDFEKFYVQFIYANTHFQVRKKAVSKATPPNSTAQGLPEEWLKQFPILKEKHPGPDYLSVIYADIIKSMLFQGRIGNASPFQTSYNSFKAFRGNVRFSEVTSNFLKEYETWMIHVKENSKTTVGIYCRALRAVINEAIERKLMDKDSYPFGKKRYGIPTGRNIKKALSQETVAKLYYTDVEERSHEMAKDFWFFSFNGNGMNVKDMINLKYKNIKDTFLTFEWAKTELTSRGREPIIITCDITEDMWRIIEKWGNKDKDPDNYIFPVLSRGLTPLEQFRIKKNFNRFINKNMAKVSVKAKVGKPAKTMETRHSFSTILKNAGVSPYYIKEKLGHALLKTTENYLGGFEDEQQKVASKIINNFKTKYNANPEETELKKAGLKKGPVTNLEKEIDNLSPEQIGTLHAYINNILDEKKADGDLHVESKDVATKSIWTTAQGVNLNHV